MPRFTRTGRAAGFFPDGAVAELVVAGVTLLESALRAAFKLAIASSIAVNNCFFVILQVYRICSVLWGDLNAMLSRIMFDRVILGCFCLFLEQKKVTWFSEAAS